jgi:hypothetical protein
MTLRRASCQGSVPLEEFYQGLADLGPENVISGMGKRMLELLPGLKALFQPIDAWAVTSHETLCLHNVDDYRVPWLVAVEPTPTSFVVSCRMPARLALWVDAWVRGYASSTDSALQMVKVALLYCEGWPAAPL